MDKQIYTLLVKGGYTAEIDCIELTEIFADDFSVSFTTSVTKHLFH